MSNHVLMSHLNPSGSYAETLNRSVQLNNQALAAESTGDLAEAERLHLEAISLKEGILGNEHPTTALSYNGLGELYLKMNKLDEAEQYLSKAVQIRNSRGTVFDAAVSRENMAQLQEARGDLAQAKECRLAGAPDRIACGYFQCPGQTFSLSQLKVCGKCKSISFVGVSSPSITVPLDVSKMIGEAVTNLYARWLPEEGVKLSLISRIGSAQIRLLL